jgi:hypothetical protein
MFTRLPTPLGGQDLEALAKLPELIGGEAGGMPAVGVLERPPQHPVDEIGRSVRIGRAGQVDRGRCLHRLRQRPDAVETVEAAVERDRVLAPEPSHHLHRLGESRHPVASGDPVRSELARVAAADAHREVHAAAADDVEARPLDREEDRIPDDERGQTSDVKPHAARPGGQRAEQRDDLEPRLLEEVVSDAHAVEVAGPVGGLRGAEKVLDAEEAEQHAAVGQAEREARPAGRLPHRPDQRTIAAVPRFSMNPRPYGVKVRFRT